MAAIISKKLTLIFLGFVIILAIFLRIYNLNTVPPELFGDELDVGYQAYSLLKTGKDLQGNFLPLYIKSLAESRAPLYIYSTIPFVAIFGLNEWGVRLAAAFWGTAGVLVIYFLTQKLFKNSLISTISAFMLAISPWHLHYSRAAFEVTLLFFLIISATYFFLKSLKEPKFLIPTAVLFALTPYTYSTAAVFMPLFTVALLIIFRSKLKYFWQSNSFKLAILIFFTILAPFVYQTLFGQATNRFSQISVAVNPEIEKNINLSRQLDKTQGFIFHNKQSLIFHNKPLSFLFESSRNYLWAFSPQFLFTDGDPIGRHSVGQMGQFYWFMLPLMLIGVFTLLTDKIIERQNKLLIFSWLILAPIPSSLTYDGGAHATRLFLLLPPLIIIAALGGWKVLTDWQATRVKTIAITIIVFLATINLIFYFHRYYIHYPIESWRWWQIGYKEAFVYIKDHQDQYDTIVINNTYEPSLIRFLFYVQYDPAKFHQNFKGDKPIQQILPGIDGFVLEDKYYSEGTKSPRFYFGTLLVETKGANELAKVLNTKTLYLASQRDEVVGDLDLRKSAPEKIKVLKTITNQFNEPIFYVLTSSADK